MSYHMTGRRSLRGFGEDLNLDPYAGMPCKSVPFNAAITGQTGTGQLCYYGTCGDVNALRQALQDLGFGPITASTNLGAAGGPLAKAAAKYGTSYTAGSSPSADLCVAILNSWRAPSTTKIVMPSRFVALTAGVTRRIAAPSTKATCVGECLYWDGVEQKCFTITMGKCATAQQQTGGKVLTPRGGAAAGGGTVAPGPTGMPLLEIPPETICAYQQGTWDAATGTCTGGAAQATPQQTELACNAAGGIYDPATGQCLVGGEQPPADQGWWSGLSDTTKYAIIGGAVLGVAAIGTGIYMVVRKPKAKANRRQRYARRNQDLPVAQAQPVEQKTETAGQPSSTTGSVAAKPNARRGHRVVRRGKKR